MDIKAIARLYSPFDFQVIREINHWNTDNDKRFVLLLRFADGQELAVKICHNAFTSHQRVSGWKALSNAYMDMGIYCPPFVDSLNGNASEAISIDGAEYIVYAEEMKKYKSYDELEPKPDFEAIRPAIIESIGRVAAG